MTSLPFKSTRYNVPYIVVSGSGTIGNELNVKGQTHLSESATIAQDIIYGGSLNIVPGSGISFDGKTMTNTGQVTPLTSGENIAISSGTVGVVDSPTFSNLTVEGQTNSTLFVGGFHNEGGLVLAGTAPAGDISLSAPGITFEYVNGGGVLWGGIKNLPTSLGIASSGTLASAINTEFFFNPSGSVAIRDYGNDTYRIYTPITIDQIASMPVGVGIGVGSGTIFSTAAIISTLTGSGTYTAPITGFYKLMMCGGGGGGNTDNHSGGGGAGCFIGMLYLTEGTAYNYSVGLGGAAGGTGANGENTTFGSIVCYGGGGGGATISITYSGSGGMATYSGTAAGGAASSSGGISGQVLGPLFGGASGGGGGVSVANNGGSSPYGAYGGIGNASGNGGGASAIGNGSGGQTGTVGTSGTLGGGGGGGGSGVAGAGGDGFIWLSLP